MITNTDFSNLFNAFLIFSLVALWFNVFNLHSYRKKIEQLDKEIMLLKKNLKNNE